LDHRRPAAFRRKGQKKIRRPFQSKACPVRAPIITGLLPSCPPYDPRLERREDRAANLEPEGAIRATSRGLFPTVENLGSCPAQQNRSSPGSGAEAQPDPVVTPVSTARRARPVRLPHQRLCPFLLYCGPGARKKSSWNWTAPHRPLQPERGRAGRKWPQLLATVPPRRPRPGGALGRASSTTARP